MLGNASTVHPPMAGMEKDDIVAPFVGAFEPVTEGGCADARPTTRAHSCVAMNKFKLVKLTIYPWLRKTYFNFMRYDKTHAVCACAAARSIAAWNRFRTSLTRFAVE